MTEHNLFYYPYASFTNAQLPLLKVAALWFDKLYILNPIKAVSGGEEFAFGSESRDQIAADVKLLKDEKILEWIDPAKVLGQYDSSIAAAIQDDLRDRDYIELCVQSAKPRKWIIALAKVPESLSLDQVEQKLMGELPNSQIPLLEPYYQSLPDKARYEEVALEPYTEHSFWLDENRRRIDYRYREFSLPLGESIMLNHALFGGLLYKRAIPLTDDPFHSSVLDQKMRRIRAIPEIRQVLDDKLQRRGIAKNLLAATAMRDERLELPHLSPELSLQTILEFRDKHRDELGLAREKLGKTAAWIEREPWSDDFRMDLKKGVREISTQLDETRKARDAWLKSQRGRLVLKATGVTLGAAAATTALVISAAPLTPLALVAAGLGLASGAVIPGAEWFLDWRDGKKSVQENGLHYLLMI